MKQTQNALKFLLAQYRAIFKHAYVKGLATAAIVTAGLAVGQAQAAEPETFELYGFTGGIAKGNWGPKSLTADYVQLNEGNIGNTVNTLFHSNFAELVKNPGWSADILQGVQSGGLTYYSGSSIAKGQNGVSENATALKHVNIIGKHNIDKENNTLLTDVSGAVLTLGSGGAIDIDLVRATSGGTATGGAIFAGFALNDGKDARTLNVHNNTLNVTGQRYADHAVVAGYVANSSGAAISNSNTLNYQSTVVKQSAESDADTYGATLLAGFAQGTAGATANNNTMKLGTELKNDATVDISQKVLFGGGYAKTLDNDNVNAASGNVSASNNTVEMSNFSYDSTKRDAGVTYENRSYIFGGFVDLFSKNANTAPNYGIAATASDNSLTLTNAKIYNAKDKTQALVIHGGFARSDSTASGDTAISVDASNNALTIKGSVERNSTYTTDITLFNTGDQIVAGKATHNQKDVDNNVTSTANQNTLTVDTIKMTGGKLVGALAATETVEDGHKSNVVVTGNTLSVQGNSILTNTSLLAASVQGQNDAITHSGNAVSVASNALAIADGDNVDIAGDTADIAGKVWVKGTDGSSVTFGGVLKEGASSADNKYFNGTGTLTGTLYNQGGTVNVYNELDITKGTIYALGNNAIINVDGSKSAETDDKGDALPQDPLTAGYATLKTSEQQIKNYLTSGSATNVTLPKVNASETETKVKESSAGVLAVTKGGAVDFGTSVTLSDFNFANSTTAGAIIVDAKGVVSGSSTFRADTVNVEHVLATNATTQTDIDKLTGVDASNVHLVANTLNLGTSSLTSEQSSKIAFNDAKVKNEINFMVTSGKDGADGFVLTSAKVKGDNYTITNSADSKNQYYTTDVLGNINGAVTISGTGTTKGELSIANGDWQANDAITLAGSGALSVGGQSTDPGYLDKTGNNNPSLPDATLKLTSALTIEDDASAATTVTVTGNTTGNQPYKYEHAQDTLGDDGLSFLDLTAGLNIVDADGKVKDGSFAGKTTITAQNGGVILLNGSDVSAILAANNKTSDDTLGAIFEATAGGALVFATDGGELQVGFDDFTSTTNNHGINIATNGYLAANTISVTELAPSTGEGSSSNPVDETGDWTRNFVDFGSSANVYVGDLTVSDLRASSAGNYVSEAGIATGNVYIFNTLSSNNSTLLIGNPDPDKAATKANLTFFTPYVSDTGSIGGISTLQVNNGSKLSFDNGTWDAAGTTIELASGSLTVGGNNLHGEDFAGIDVYTTLNAQGLVVADGSSVKVTNNGVANFATADFSALSAPADNESADVVIYGVMNIEDAASSVDGSNKTVYSLFGEDGSIYIGKNGKLTFGSAATNHAIIADDKYTGSGSITAVFDANTGFGKIENQGGTLTLGLADSTTFDSEAIVALKHELFTENSFNSQGLLNNGGVLNIGLAHFEGYEVTPVTINGVDGYTATWEQLAKFADVYSPDVTNESYLHTNVTAVGLDDNIIGHWGSLSLVPNVATSDAAKTQATIAGDTTLNFAAGNGGFFVSDSTHSFALGAFVQAGKSLSLNNGGTIGYVTLETVSQELGDNAVDEAATVLQVSGDGTTYITAIDTRGEYRRNTNVTILGNAEVAKDVSVGEVDAYGGSLLVKGNTLADRVEVEDNGSIDVAQKLTTSDVWIASGSLKATDFVFDNNDNDNNIDIIGGGKLTANTFVVSDAQKAPDTYISVGADSYDVDEFNTVLGTDYTGTGYFEVGTLTLNGAHLVVDPAYGQATAIASVNRFKQGNETYAYDTVTGTISGTVEIGQNAALGIGTASVDEVADVIALYQNNGSLSADKYGSILYLNGQTKLAEGSSIALNAKAQSADEISNSLLYGKTDANKNVTQQYADLGLGANTALILSERAFDNVAGDRAGVALTFARADAHVAGNGGEIVLVGTFDAAKPLNFFKDGDTNGVNIEGQDIVVRTQNGFLFTVLEAGTEAGYGEQLQVDKDQAYNIMSEASDPVVETLIAYHEGRIDPTLAGNQQQQEQQTVTEEQPATEERAATNPDLGAQVDTPVPEQEQITNDTTTETTAVVGRSDFLNEVVTNSHGAPAEAAARLAIYGGTVHAALGASSTTTDAIAARLGVGNAAGLTIANNGQGAALWVAPVYKSHDSDGFDSQGLDYGVDLNLYGVALGADLEIIPGFTAGLMFNVGSGDVDGKGNTAANNTSNDFDYWGAALYGSYRYDALTVAADIGYTVVDNDLEATTGMDKYSKLESSADSTALTFGVTAKYAFDFNTVEVAPHAGLRYTNVDLDDYTVTANGEDVAHFDAGSISVFSIPVGVTVAKEFQGDNWSVKPMFDLTLTGNFGDDEVDGTVSWTGVDNLTTGVSSEFLDNFTYGATLGVEAKTGSFSFGLGVNYTGSSNADEYGVNANARFVF